MATGNGTRKRRTLRERLVENTRRSVTADGCDTWTGAVTSCGYGNVRDGRRQLRAHRAAVIVATGAEIPDGSFVLHSCDNRLCVKLTHLRLGTHRDNMDDRARRGRSARGARIGRSQLNEAKVYAMRRAYASGVSQTKIARTSGVTQACVGSVVNGRTWRHVPMVPDVPGVKRTGVGVRGNQNAALISEVQAVEVLAMLAEGHMTQVEIGVCVGLKQSTVSNIHTGKRWGHLARPERK